MCVDKQCHRNSVRYEYATSYEEKPRTIWVEKMEKKKRLVKKEITKDEPWMEEFTDYKTEWRKEMTNRDV